MNKEQEVRIITEYNKGVRCGHCGDRSKVGETWISPGRSWIGDMAICYGHKKCVEEAINIALLKQPECETCGGSGKLHCKSVAPGTINCPDCQKPPASELHPNKKGREDCEGCLYPERHCSECINGDNRAKVSQAFESNEKPPASEFTKRMRIIYNEHTWGNCQVYEDIIDLCDRLDKAEAENKSQAEHIELLNQCDNTSTGTIASMDAEMTSLEEMNNMQAERIEELEALRDTVQISCNPPKDCNDSVVLKTYMKGCFDEAMKL